MWHLWVAYALAQFVHIFAKATLAKQSKLNGIATYREYFRVNAAAIGIRFALLTGFFVWWFDDPTIVSKLAHAVSGVLAPGMIRSAIEAVSFPLNIGTVILYGVASDAILDKFIALVPWLRKEIPPVSESAEGAGK